MTDTTTSIQTRISQLKGIQADRKRRVKDAEAQILSLEEQKKTLEEAVQTCLSASHYIQHRLQYCISTIVTKALEAVFDDPYQFQMSFNTRGDKNLEVSLSLVRDGEELDPLTACGGGVIDLLSYALRLSCLLIAHPAPDRVIILDEPFKHLSRDLQPRVRTMLEEISKELDIQHIIVTHEEILEG